LHAAPRSRAVERRKEACEACPTKLRSVVDDLLFDVMYALPDEEPGRKFLVTPEVVRGTVKLFPRDDSAAA
jgi:ATP-dependent protease Clp ATPase subunit